MMAHAIAGQTPHLRYHSINVGELHVARRGTLIRTVLGSCIAVCLYDPVNGVGGMNHYLRPHGPHDAAPDIRYGAHAIPILIQRCLSKGASIETMVAKVFGGGSMQVNSVEFAQRVGQVNIQYALEVLTARNITVASQDTGGQFARDVRFDTSTGTVRVKRILVGDSPV